MERRSGILFEKLLRKPGGDIEQSVGYEPRFEGAGQAGDVHLGLFRVDMTFSAMREHRAIKRVTVDWEERGSRTMAWCIPRKEAGRLSKNQQWELTRGCCETREKPGDWDPAHAEEEYQEEGAAMVSNVLTCQVQHSLRSDHRI